VSLKAKASVGGKGVTEERDMVLGCRTAGNEGKRERDHARDGSETMKAPIGHPQSQCGCRHGVKQKSAKMDATEKYERAMDKHKV